MILLLTSLRTQHCICRLFFLLKVNPLSFESKNQAKNIPVLLKFVCSNKLTISVPCLAETDLDTYDFTPIVRNLFTFFLLIWYCGKKALNCFFLFFLWKFYMFQKSQGLAKKFMIA